ncbi:MAG: ribosome biogenesis GTPase YlqF [Gammaproteobacteria bacterium]|nr:ribosome biogenesis GTPase YlqF [Gammaproteobacteria bacterium]
MTHIQWFPGHMHKARKEMEKVLPRVDLIIEVLDARIPFSSENPMIGELAGDKPCIKILNKSDLADPQATQIWQDFFEASQHVKSLATRSDEPDNIRKISTLCRKMLPAGEQDFRPLHTMIMGIPNVGKSTIINILAGRTIAKTGNEPAVTKAQQRIKLDNGISLSDTPGVLWPNLENSNSGFRLAMTGAIKDTALEHVEVALFAADFFLHNHPEKLQARYQLDELPANDLAALEAIGKKRGCLGSGGLVDLDRVAKILLSEYRAGMLGRFTLETPQVMQQELAELEIIRAQKAEKKRLRQEGRKKKSRR